MTKQGKDMTDKQPKEAVKNSATRTLEALQLYASKSPIIQSYVRTGIETDISKLIEAKRDHHTFTQLMMAHLRELDFVFNHNRFRFKTESAHINTASLMYIMDMFFTWIDKTAKHFPIPPPEPQAVEKTVGPQEVEAVQPQEVEAVQPQEVETVQPQEAP